mmetsp:Transcript_45636/g.146930  ORF Transcript_45636/g.146930 Transcript_45636/m.146930 type:complete len:268 (+) Transcript_45636:136-939(+)
MSAGRAGGWRGGNCGAWRVADLRDECAFKGLDTSGGKSALIARLDQHAARRTDGLDDSPFRHLSDDEHREICGVLLGFHAADAFCGRRPGCVFKTGGWGLGYYVDAAPCARDLLMFGSTCRDLRAIMMPPLQPYVANQLKQFRDFGDARQRTIRGEAHRCSVDSSLGSDPFRGIQWAGMPRKVEKKELAVLQVGLRLAARCGVCERHGPLFRQIVRMHKELRQFIESEALARKRRQAHGDYPPPFWSKAFHKRCVIAAGWFLQPGLP